MDATPRAGFQPDAGSWAGQLDLPRQRMLEVPFGVKDRTLHRQRGQGTCHIYVQPEPLGSGEANLTATLVTVWRRTGHAVSPISGATLRSRFPTCPGRSNGRAMGGAPWRSRRIFRGPPVPGPLASVGVDKTTPVPDLDALGDFAMAAARNARRLLDDAELLLRRGRSPSAYSLAVLAFEEAGKAWMSVVAMMVPGDVRPEWPYGDLTNKHVDKLMAAHVMAHMLVSASSGQDMITSLADIGENLEELARRASTRPSSAACTPTFSMAQSGTRHWSPSTKPGAWSPSSAACWITVVTWPIPSS